MTIQIIPVQTKSELKAFIRMPYSIYANDPHWVAPLEFERKEFFNPKKNPFYKNGEAQLFLAYQNGKPVGRISAQTYRLHLELYKDQTGFFGFFESVDDLQIAAALIDAATGWLKKKGLKKIRGPLHFTMNDEVGILIDGFKTPPYLLMNHNPPYYSGLLERAGFKKAKDLFAYTYDVGAIPEQAQQLSDVTKNMPGVVLRPIDMKRFNEEITLMMKIFNEAWAQNWGFVPMTEEEIVYVAKNLKPIVDPEMACFATVNGEPAAMSIALPNVNEAIADLKGKLFPFGWAKLLWRLKTNKLKSLRLCLMGIRPQFRGGKVGYFSVFMNVEMHRRGLARGYKVGELSWTLEDNEKINKGIEFLGGKRYKTYRVYEKDL